MENNIHSIEDFGKYTLALKEVLTFQEGCLYTGLSKSKMYKHTSQGKVAFYKPEGKNIYFKRVDLDSFMLRNRHSTMEELETLAANRILTKNPLKS